MNGTPRLRSAFPTTPQPNSRTAGPSNLRNGGLAKPKVVPPKAPDPSFEVDLSPRIPLNILDAASQRLFAFAFYICLWAWRLADFWALYTSDDTQSFPLFMKWVLIDAAFLFGLPGLRIPWISWSGSAMTVLFLTHALFNAILMFQIGLPVAYLAESVVKLVYEREIAISERRVKPASVLDHSSLILGKQVIHILPEGSAMLNPGNEHFCIGGEKSQVQIPIQINQTNPVLIELLRRDLDSTYNETLTIKASEAKKLRTAAMDAHKRTKGSLQAQDPLVLRYTVRKPGQYTIQKVVDVSKLEVGPRQSEVVVVSCPSARVKTESNSRCKGDLSDISFEVEGTPPLKIKYRKLVNGNPTEASFQSIQPNDFVSSSPKSQQKGSSKAETFDISWARSRLTRVSINETMMTLGDYSYAIDEVQDVLGNKVTYNRPNEDDYYGSGKVTAGTRETVTVRDRPLIWIPRQAECNAERPLKVAQGSEVSFPHRITSVGRTDYELDWGIDGEYKFQEDHYVEYEFTPESELEGTSQPKIFKVRKSSPTSPIVVKNPGLYVLKKVWTDHCAGEVSAASSCLLQNPLRPEVKVSSSEISDKCADSPIGLRVNFEFTGSPPFTIKYREEKSGARKSHLQSATFPGHRGQLDLVPVSEGHYKYTFSELSDHYYVYVPMNQALSQDVRPAASAHFRGDTKQNICLGESSVFYVQLIGEPPWTLEYEIIHGKSRQKLSQQNITTNLYELVVPPQKDGGEYSVSLASVSDKSGCKELPKSEAKFQVWSQKPAAAFGLVNGKRTAQILEGSSLRIPLKFTGQPTFNYKITLEETGETVSKVSAHVSDVFTAVSAGTYIISDVGDQFCTGIPDSTADRFSISWISRPSLGISQHPSISAEGGKHAKKDVCEGEDDYAELALQGTPPFDVAYEEHAKLDDGQKLLRRRELNAPQGLATIQLDTSKSGQYEYKFGQVADSNYRHSPKAKKDADLVLTQRVHPRPTARFSNPGKTFSFCTTEDPEEDVIPISFTGVPPFELDVDLKFSGSASPESIPLTGIGSNQYELKVPRKYLRPGHSHLTIRRVRDGRGCQSKTDTSVPPSRVQISVHDPPEIVSLESKEDFCVGDRLSFRLSGVNPFTVFYTFDGSSRKATSKKTTFRRLAERPGEFVITGVSDSGSNCRFGTQLTNTIHPLPTVKMSHGRESYVDIHEGGETELLFEFTGTPPFEFTYTRSENERKGKKGRVLETKTEKTDKMSVRLKASEEGTYEVVAVRDKWCSVSKFAAGEVKRERLLTN